MAFRTGRKIINREVDDFRVSTLGTDNFNRLLFRTIRPLHQNSIKSEKVIVITESCLYHSAFVFNKGLAYLY